MTDDLISRAEAMAYPLSWEHYDREHGSREFISGVESYREYIEHLPSAQPKRGEWIGYDSMEDKFDDIRCSCCQRLFTVDAYHFTDIGFTKDDLKFCPNCGARMNSSEKPNNCETCKHNKLEWYSEVCDGCSKAHSNYEPQTERSE